MRTVKNIGNESVTIKDGKDSDLTVSPNETVETDDVTAEYLLGMITKDDAGNILAAFEEVV